MGVGKIELVEIVVYVCFFGVKIRNISSWKKWNICWFIWLKFFVCFCLCVCVFFWRFYFYLYVEIFVFVIVMIFLIFFFDINLVIFLRLIVDRICLGGGCSFSVFVMYFWRNSLFIWVYKGWGFILLYILVFVLVFKL